MAGAFFSKEIYIERRRKLSEQVGTGLVLLLGNEESSMNYKDNWYRFRQDSSFLYYAGLDLAGLALVIDIDKNEEYLVGEDASIDDIIWTGPLPSIQELAHSVGINRSINYKNLQTIIGKAQESQQTIHLLPPYRPENSIKLANWLSVGLGGVEKYVSVKLIRSIVAQREIKEAIEIAEMDKANSISAEMHLEVIRNARPGMREYELVAYTEAVSNKYWGRLAYSTILTVNGQTLHNHYYGNTIQEGQMVLVDAGAEAESHYAGDLTRTFPVAKTFTTQQKEIYNIVLRSLDHATSLLKPGIQYREIHAQASLELLKGLRDIGIVKGSPEDALAADVHTLFFQCGLGHMIGLDVHDMEDLGEQYVGYGDELVKSKSFGWKSLRLAKTLQPGFTLTVEPGLYFIPELIDRRKAEKQFVDFVNYDLLESFKKFGGVRIEDNYVITENAARKLGNHLPRTAEEMESLR